MARKDKRAMILGAAEQVFRDRRFHEVTLDQIAAQAHVGKGTIYLYFRSKEDLFFQLATDGLDEVCDLVYAVAASSRPFREKVLAMCQALSDFFTGRHGVMRAMHDEHYLCSKRGADMRARFRPVRDKVRMAIQRLLQQGVDEGLLRSDLDVATLECSIAGAMHFRDHRMIHGEEALPIEGLVDVFLEGAVRRS